MLRHALGVLMLTICTKGQPLLLIPFCMLEPIMCRKRLPCTFLNCYVIISPFQDLLPLWISVQLLVGKARSWPACCPKGPYLSAMNLCPRGLRCLQRICRNGRAQPRVNILSVVLSRKTIRLILWSLQTRLICCLLTFLALARECSARMRLLFRNGVYRMWISAGVVSARSCKVSGMC